MTKITQELILRPVLGDLDLPQLWGEGKIVGSPRLCRQIDSIVP